MELRGGFFGRTFLACGALAAGVVGQAAAAERTGDFYMFRSYEPGRQDFVTLIATFRPRPDAAAGPSLLDEDAIYQIKIDNNGDALEDITFSFVFRNVRRNQALNVGGVNVPVPLPATGPISTPQDPDLNLVEVYTAGIARGPGNPGRVLLRGAQGGTQFTKPLDNLGPRSIPDYAAYAAAHVYPVTVPGCAGVGRVFVGQRDDPFAANTADLTDLFNTDLLGPADGEPDTLEGRGVTAIVLEVPIACITRPGEPVIGGWATVNVRRGRFVFPGPDFAVINQGPLTQVARIGAPLVDEFFIGLPDLERFNATAPERDEAFHHYFTTPTLPALLAPQVPAVSPCLPREDLAEMYLMGIPGLNQPAGVHPSEMLRLNTSIPPAPPAAQNALGVLGNDPAGYPNGRRPGDDVVDITLRAAMGVLLPEWCAPQGGLPFTDGAYTDAQRFSPGFPYLTSPLPGAVN